jgi:RNA polymerase sigma-70 factor (ECF subfamily)
VSSSLQSAVAFLIRTGATEPSRLEDEVTGFYDEFRGPVLRYLYSLRISPDDGEELVQEVFLALFRHLRAEKPRDNLRGWIFQVAHNLALKNRIGRMRHPETDAEMEHTDPGLNPEQLASGKQRQARLLSVVRALPEQDRFCLSLRAEGFRYREIARILGISLGSVANALERSIARLSRADGGR